MTSESLSAVVLDVLKNNRSLGKSLVGADRVGGTRLIKKNLSGKFGNRAQKATDFLIRSIDIGSDRADRALDKVFDLTSTAIVKVADNKYATQYFDLVSKVTLPTAKVARSLGGKLADRINKVHYTGGTKTGVKAVKHRRARRKSTR